MITFDNLMLNTFLSENKDFIQGSRIYKIQQPTRRELILALRNNGTTRQLYINITPQNYHVCFASPQTLKERLIEIPQKPPMFCMLLRKYLNNSRIAKVNQPDGERILELFIETYNEIRDKIYLCLALELMGKYSNVILYNTDTDIILGAAHNVGEDKSTVREVYGTIPYTYPPKQNNQGFIYERYAFLLNYLKCAPIDIYKKLYNDYSSVLDNYYAYLTGKDKFLALKNKYLSEIRQMLKKEEKSFQKMNYQIQKSEDYDKYRLRADLLMANLYNLKDYTKNAVVFDYEHNEEISLPLNETKTIKENANDFYKKYNKLKNTKNKLCELVENAQQKKDYLKSLIYSIEITQNIDELKDIEPEISKIKGTSNETKSEQNKKSEPMMIEKGGNTRIYIGKNNKQNDYIVSKLAQDDDLWFHTKDCPGSHVLLKTQKVTDGLILECAKLAKKYSQGSDSSKIGVIYTKRKYLRKPPKANLGYVTYRNEKEIVID